MSPSSSASYGQVIEYIPDRLYLASYTHPPTDQTPFPYPTSASQSPSKRSGRSRAGTNSTETSSAARPPIYFSIDESLLYNAFHHDFGPLHIGHLYRFAVQLHDLLVEGEDRGVVFWSKADARSRANAACLLACYMVLIQSWPPHLALAPIAQADPPFMPFRDAGYSQADYVIGLQDVVYGVWKAKEEELCGLADFSLHEYEKYERVDMGDFNWLTPSFLAFASPQHAPVQAVPQSSSAYEKIPKSVSALVASDLPRPFKNVLIHFSMRNVGLVVRLNSELYSPSYFTALGMSHIDMIFDDGTCPPLMLVRKFIKLAHETITVKHRGIAVHCKAGLGRTGCLIGAYLIYRHGFTANEVIAFMRFMRPGMVVGPQQHWLHLNQGVFREWYWEDTMKEKLAAMLPSTPKTSQKHRVVQTQPANTPSTQQSKRAPLGEVDNNEGQAVPVQDDNLPAPTPGQPRKASRIRDRHHPYSRVTSASHTQDESNGGQGSTEIIAMHRHAQGESESEEEWQLRMLARRTSSRSPTAPARETRAVSCTTTTTSYQVPVGSESDIENHHHMGTPPQQPRTPAGSKSGSGASNLSVSKVRSSPKRNSDKAAGLKEGGYATSNGVRKTSGRVGSVGAMGTARRKS
ncbi:MAG: cell division control protein 14 [Thelocarpon superellum]|nr:MAG: cell division control protein 14 [Thelocarpon superellum]